MQWRRPAGTRSPSVVPALLAALALLLGLPLASAASAVESTRPAGYTSVAVSGSAAERADKLARQSTLVLKVSRADSHRPGVVESFDDSGWAGLPSAVSVPRPQLEVSAAGRTDLLPAPPASDLRSRAPPMPHAVLASGIPLRRR